MFSILFRFARTLSMRGLTPCTKRKNKSMMNRLPTRQRVSSVSPASLLTLALFLCPTVASARQIPAASEQHGEYLLSRGQYVKAIAVFDEVIRRNPKNNTAYVNRGLAYDDLNQHDKAIADYSAALRLDPKDAQAYANRGGVYNTLKQYGKGLTDCDKAISLDPKLETAYYNRGIAHRHLKQYEKALADYSEAMRLNPKDSNPVINRGVVYGDLKQYNKVVADLEAYLKMVPNAPDAAKVREAIADAKSELKARGAGGAAM